MARLSSRWASNGCSSARSLALGHGGEIWLSRDNRLIDGGIALALEMGVYDEDDCLIENHGAEPDIVVDNLPHTSYTGEDAQLIAAVAELRAQLVAAPISMPVAPPYPDRAYRGEVGDDYGVSGAT